METVEAKIVQVFWNMFSEAHKTQKIFTFNEVVIIVQIQLSMYINMLNAL